MTGLADLEARVADTVYAAEVARTLQEHFLDMKTAKREGNYLTFCLTVEQLDQLCWMSGEACAKAAEMQSLYLQALHVDQVPS